MPLQPKGYALVERIMDEMALQIPLLTCRPVLFVNLTLNRDLSKLDQTAEPCWIARAPLEPTPHEHVSAQKMVKRGVMTLTEHLLNLIEDSSRPQLVCVRHEDPRMLIFDICECCISLGGVIVEFPPEYAGAGTFCNLDCPICAVRIKHYNIVTPVHTLQTIWEVNSFI